jgi:hypothetical protein
METEKTKLFIKRERIRRNLINTRMGETICLQDWEVQLLLSWIKELESEVVKNGGQIGTKADRKGKVADHWCR